MYPAGAITTMAIQVRRVRCIDRRFGIGYGRSVSLNLIHLIGLVAARPSTREPERACTVLLVTCSSHGEDRQRHRVVAYGRLAGTASGLTVGEPVFVAGRLGHDERHRVITVARELWAVSEPPLQLRPPAATEGHHASPRDHERVGHWRRINVATPRERLCWVRATAVRAKQPTACPLARRRDLGGSGRKPLESAALTP